MNLFRNRSRGRLTGDDLDTLVRWSMRESVDGARPSDAAWQRIAAGVRARRATTMRAPRPASSLDGLGALLSFMYNRAVRRDAADYAADWREAHNLQAHVGLGMIWSALSPSEIVALGTHVSAARLA